VGSGKNARMPDSNPSDDGDAKDIRRELGIEEDADS
jgi:hypothetical protein